MGAISAIVLLVRGLESDMRIIPRSRSSVFIVLMGLFGFGCCEDCEQPVCPDAAPPRAVTDLIAAVTTDSSVTLIWTAPGDDGEQGIAGQYDIRYSTGEYSGAEWWDTLATVIAMPPTPNVGGSPESLLVGGLMPDTVYTFALKTADEVPNWSGMSNVFWVSMGVPDEPVLHTEPTILDFGATATEHFLIITNTGTGTLSWTIMANQNWISLSPQSGTTTTEEDTITVTVERGALALGDYTGSLTVTPDVGEALEIDLRMRVTATQLSGLVLVPAGSFVMGDGMAHNGEDEHTVTLTRDFYLGQHEVTNQEYLDALQWAYGQGHVTATTAEVRDNFDGVTWMLLDLESEYCEIQFDGAGTFFLRESPSSLAQSAYPGGYDPADHPVKEVSWFGAMRYCDWLSLRAGHPRAHSGFGWCNQGDPYGAEGYRLPTDAEWEFAAQYDNERVYPWGDEDPDFNMANFAHQLLRRSWTTPVRTFPDAPELLGLSDMAGNVWEWCYDIIQTSLGSDPLTDPVIDSEGGGPRVVRGGGWNDGDAILRCAFRSYLMDVQHGKTAGFRVARTASP